ncbi:MAG: aminodeoxychorismate synthase component I [Jaaginema sp. PMC 1078.18]|nr:aminodeoxychorismate synthase component I [Jaaginema sp. PMC 1078.18]
MTFTVSDYTEIPAILDKVQQAVEQHHCYAVGFLSYEAAPAFDASFQVQTTTAFPVAWWGLYEQPQVISPPIKRDRAPITLPWQPSISRQQYQQCLTKIKHYIAQGITYQVNYSFRLNAQFTLDPLTYFWQLNQAQDGLYSAFINLENWAICSASPELFFTKRDRQVICRPMKGTAPRGLTYERDREIAQILRTSPKEQAENLMIVDMIRNDLGRIADLGSVKVRHLFNLEKYPTLWQMTSPVECQTDANIKDIFQALFPCASIVGAPKSSTLKIIRELEDSPRRIYTGTIGFITPSNCAQFNVAIRTVLIDKSKQQAEYGVGGGIVWDSTEKNEYDECCTKAKILTRTTPTFALLESVLWTPEQNYFLLDFHLNRLQESAAYFNFSFDREKVRDRLHHLVQTLSPHPHKIRLQCHQNGNPEVSGKIIQQRPSNLLLKVGLAQSPIQTDNAFIYHKTTYRRHYETFQKQQPQYDDVILWNEKQEVTESCIANIIVEDRDGKWYTPPIACGLLPGTYRAWLLQQNRVTEKIIPVAELPLYSRIFLVNSVRKMQEVRLL